MPRPKTKDDLLKIGQDSYRELVSLATLVADEMGSASFPFEHRDRNVRDVLGHLNEWQTLFSEWYRVGMKGEMPYPPDTEQ